MASFLISRSHHIDFDSVFRFDDAEIVQMFESLVTTGLMEFLGCPAIFHENALTEFFANGSVRDGMVVSTIGGIAVEISESVFSAAFGLPTAGLTDLSEVPRNLLSDAQSLFSASEKEVSISCLKKEIKMQYRLLSDILAKSLFVKAGSFDAVTRDCFLLMTVITFDVKVNWGNLLFGVLKEIVTPDSRQAKGYAIQICVLLKNIPGLELGESKAFPAPCILNEKTVHRIVSVNENVGVEEVGEAPRTKKTPVKKTMSKKRQAASEAEVAPVIKKKRSTKGKSAVARRISLDKQVEDTTADEEDSLGGTVGKVSHVPVQVAPILDDVDMIIRQVISESTDLSSNKEDQGDKLVDETDIGDDFGAWLNSSFPGFDLDPDSSPAASPPQKSSSSSSDASIHFDSEDLPVHDQDAAHTSAPVDSNVFTNSLEDLRSYISQRIHESTSEIRSKVNDATFNVRGDLLKQQAWHRHTFQDACDVLERQSKQVNDLKKGLMAPVGTIFQDLFDIKKNQRAQEAKLNALDGQVAALRNEQLEFQNIISADLLSLSTQFDDIVEFIHGGDSKKGEGGSNSRHPPVRVERRPLPTPQSPRDVAGSSSAVRIPTFPRTTGTFAE
ncbi:hypothetical protein F511_31751 [Dorcoceras hygrometricum]|uniref:Dystroglycan-like n=1 Tax=Dorcoceras hygrometricum TaxID=472368 RepID=A0A2Z7A300_9LAMI|nr:hypothetical protein F511_31751 [Dorcoceras hygrometricum]